MNQIKSGRNYKCIEGALTDSEIKSLLDYWNSIELGHELLEPGQWKTESPLKTSIDFSSRKVEIVGIPIGKIPMLTERINKAFSTVLDYDFGIEGPHYFTKYGEGSYHAIHHDFLENNGILREWVITIQLSDPTEYEGGDLIIKGEKAPKTKGSFIIYKGSDLHEVTKVTSGTRFSITECAGKKTSYL